MGPLTWAGDHNWRGRLRPPTNKTRADYHSNFMGVNESSKILEKDSLVWSPAELEGLRQVGRANRL